MKALILAAGFGTRMHPFTKTMPKALAPINNIPLILYSLAFLKKNNIKDIVINLHHHGNKIKNLLKNGSHLGLNIRYSAEKTILGTGGGIRKALCYLDDDFLVINSDVIIDFNLKDFRKTHKKQGSLATLGLYQNKARKKYDVLHFNNNQLVSIINRPLPPSKTKTAMFAGIHFIAKEQLKQAIKKHKPKKKFCITTYIYIPHLESGQKLGAHLIKGPFRVCDSFQDVKKVEKEMKSKKITLSYQKELLYIARKLS